MILLFISSWGSLSYFFKLFEIKTKVQSEIAFLDVTHLKRKNDFDIILC